MAKFTIHHVCRESGTPGLAIGIFNRDGKVLDSCYGFRDVRKRLPPDIDTVFNLGPMSTGFTALAVACLISDGKLDWDNRVGKFLVELRDTENGKFTIRELLSHSTGLCKSEALFLGPSRPPHKLIYNHLGYHVVGCVIEQVSSMSYGDFLAKRIFAPLNMKRTFTTLASASDQNIAQAHVPYHDRGLCQIPPPSICSDTAAYASGCVRNCMRDLMTFYGALPRNFIDLMPKTVFRDLNMISSHIRAIFEPTMPFRDPTSLRKQSYGMGWARTQLPNQMTLFSANYDLLNAYPTIGDSSDTPLVFHQGGSSFGCSSTVYLMPELNSGIVVLGNALGHCDATDLTAQALTEAFLCGSIGTPFDKCAIAAASRQRSAMEREQEMLDKEKKASDPPTNLERYTGTFWNKTRQFRIVVALCTQGDKKELSMSLQGRQDETYTLRHYHEDFFVFNETFDQVVNRGQRWRPYWLYKIEFLPQAAEAAVDALCWRIDEEEEQGQVFKKD
ncbi:beta-lactamase/transpeptidase-like protein [Ilyonectria sp. MPI-CAGE-AT-0026]|nr:beta-lactamase/transpeptidase-like protein [Ilyonectria sp. MPI-CAGE-AT-0026]